MFAAKLYWEKWVRQEDGLQAWHWPSLGTPILPPSLCVHFLAPELVVANPVGTQTEEMSGWDTGVAQCLPSPASFQNICTLSGCPGKLHRSTLSSLTCTLAAALLNAEHHRLGAPPFIPILGPFMIPPQAFGFGNEASLELVTDTLHTKSFCCIIKETNTPKALGYHLPESLSK